MYILTGKYDKLIHLSQIYRTARIFICFVTKQRIGAQTQPYIKTQHVTLSNKTIDFKILFLVLFLSLGKGAFFSINSFNLETTTFLSQNHARPLFLP